LKNIMHKRARQRIAAKIVQFQVNLDAKKRSLVADNSMIRDQAQGDNQRPRAATRTLFLL